MKLEIDNKRKIRKFANIWKLNTPEPLMGKRRNQKENQKISGRKWEWKHNTPKLTSCHKISSKRDERINNHHIYWWKNGSFLSKIMSKTRMSTFATPIQHHARNFSQSNCTRKKSEKYPNCRGRPRTSSSHMTWLTYRKSEAYYQFPSPNTFRANKQIQQSSRIWSQNQHAETCISIH